MTERRITDGKSTPDKKTKDYKELYTLTYGIMATLLVRDCGLPKEKAVEVAKYMVALFSDFDSLGAK